jgi:AcrR family transcriptional regulator
MNEKSATDSTSRSSTQRLREALAVLLEHQVGDDPPQALTAKALCQLAGISRNALYRYHPDMLQALREAQQRHHHRPDAEKRAADQLRRENVALREQQAKLASLVDHYFAAWQESRLLLQRRERELAELRRNVRAQVIPIRP